MKTLIVSFFPMSDFTEAVHEATRQIPKGETRSYKEIAVAIGHPKAYRAVANVLKQNYDPSIPCHRVIRSDGTLGGYNRGGAEAKLRIILQEKGRV